MPYSSFEVKDQVKYEHVSPKVTSTQVGKRSQDDDKRLCLVDDLKEWLDYEDGTRLVKLVKEGSWFSHGTNQAGASSSTTIYQDAPSPSTSPTTTPIQSTNVEQPKNEDEDAKFESDTFTNPFAPLVTSSAESSSKIVDTSNMHTFQQPHSHIQRWEKDHLLVTIIGNTSKLVSTRCQLATNAMWCYFRAFITKVEPKNYKEAMKEFCWIEAMQEEIHKFK
ncbi:hypothetical protein Tco_0827702 [Tanacetum coccineum]